MVVENKKNAIRLSQVLRYRQRRGGAALLFSLFIMAFMTLMVVNVLDTTTLELSAIRNGMDYERALFLANAGIHEVAARLEANSTWSGTITDGAYPADNTYEATLLSVVNYVATVESKGVSGDVTRTVRASIEL